MMFFLHMMTFCFTYDVFHTWWYLWWWKCGQPEIEHDIFTRDAPIPLLPIYRPTDYRWSVSADNRYLQRESFPRFFHRRTCFPRPLSDGSRPCSCLSSIFTSKSIVSRPVHSFITSLWSVGIVAAAVFDGFACFFSTNNEQDLEILRCGFN